MKTVIDLVTALKTYFTGKDTAAKQAVEANIAPVETDASSSTAAYSVGDQLILNDILYDVTESISIGDALVVGTNIDAADDIVTQIKNGITLDNVPTKNSNNGVKSGGVYDADANIYAVMGKQGAKNLIPYDIETMKVINVGGTWSGNEYTYNGITFVVNSDGTITVSGIASAITRLAITTAQFENGKAYTMTGCPEGGSHVNAYTLYTQTVQNYDDGEGVTFNWSSSITSIAIAIFSGVDLTTPITFKPMLRLASDTDSTYQPYAKTNQQLTAENQTLTSLVGTTTVSTLAANATTISFTVPTTGNNLIDFWCSDGSNYTDIDTSVSGIVTLTFEASASARQVSCRIAAAS